MENGIVIVKSKQENEIMKVELELPEIKGFEYTGEYRAPRHDEWFYNDDRVTKAESDYMAEYPIMRPVAKWRDARPGDLENGPVACRCRDSIRQDWSPAVFAAYSAAPSDELRYGMVDDEGELGSWCAFCQVKDNA